MTNQQRQPRGRDSLRFPLIVTVVYAVTAGLWILLSDRAAAGFFPPAEVVTRIQTFKGLGFVAVTTIVLFVLLYHQSRLQAEMEQELRDSEEKFAAAFRGSPIGLVISTMAGVMVEVNRAFGDLTDFEREELLGETSVNLGFFTPEARRELVDAIEREGGRVPNREQTIPDRHGASHTVLLSTETITLRGEPHLVTTIQDITERKQREETLRESESRYHALFSEMLLGCAVHEAVYDDDGKMVDYVTLEVNDAFERLLGAPRESVVGKRASEILPEDELAGWLEIFRPVAATGRSTHYERYSELNQRYFEGTAYSPEKDKFAVTFSDVTESRKAEQALLESESKYHALFSEMLLGCAVCEMTYDDDGRMVDFVILEVNDAHERLLGMPRESIVGKRASELITEEELAGWLETYGPVASTGKSIRFEKFSDRVQRHFEGTAYSPEKSKFAITFSDVTDRKRAEEALRSREQELRVIVENIPALYAYVDADGHYRFVNNRYTEWYGIPYGEIVGKHARQVINEDAYKVAEPYIEQALTGRHVHYEAVVPFAKIGMRWVMVDYVPDVDEQGEVKGLFALITDITERKRAEEALRESEEKFAAAFRASPIGIVITTVVGAVVEANQAFCELLGYTREELLGKTSVGLGMFTAEARQEFTDSIRRGGGKVTNMEWTFSDRHGNSRTFLYSTETISFRGEPHFLTTCLDVTERKQAELALQQERDKAQRYLNLAGVIFIALNDRGEVTLVNPRGCQILGYKQEEIVGKDWFANFLPESKRAKVQAIFDRLMTGEAGEFGQVEGQILTRDNEERLILWHNTLLKNNSGAIVGTLSSGQDITDRKQAEKALNESEERFQQLADNIDEVFFMLDFVSGDFLYISPALEKIWGRSPEDIHTYEDFLAGVHPDDQALLREPGEPNSFLPLTEFRIVRPNGEVRWLRAYTYSIQDDQGQIIRLAGIAQDITVEREQRTLAEALANTAAIVNSTLDLSQVLGQVLDNVGQVVPHDAAEVWLVEDGIARVVGSRGHAVRDSEEVLLARRLPVDEVNNLRTARDTGQPVLINDTHDYEGWRDLGSSAWVRSLVTVPIQADDEVLGFLNLFSDKPNRHTPAQAGHLQAFANQVATAIQNARLYQELERQSESLRQAVEERTAELLQTKERVEAILNYNPDPILLLKPGGTIDTANPAFERVFGYHVDELHRQQPLSLLAPDYAEVMQSALARAIESRRVERRELVARRKDDTTFDAEVAFAPIVEGGGTLLGVVCSVRDISPLKEVARMKDAFVSNVSHELRTPITGLKLNHKLIEMDPSKSDVYLERQGREIDRLNVLIEDLLRLSRLDQNRVKLDIKPVDLNALVAQYVNDRAPLAESRDLALSLEEQTDLPGVQADAGLIGQTLSVLLTNAFNYTPAGGQVTVTTQSAGFDGRQWAGFNVGDTGPGISPADFPHLFERFYRGRAGYESGVPGTGLGLAIAREIVERHGGRIEVANQADSYAGAIFTIWLPVKEG